MTTQMAPAGPAAHPPNAPASARAPNRAVERLTGRSYLSHSQISLMRSCPQRFAFQYVEKVPKDFQPSALLLGGGIHSALELFFRAKLEGLGVTKEALLSAYHDAWNCQQRDAGDEIPVRFNIGESPDTLHALADRMIVAFLTSPLAEPKGVIVGIEEELRIVLHPDLPDVLARVDLVTQTDGSLHVIDFKTSRSRWTEQKAAESGDQLVLYGQTVARMSRSMGLPVKLHFAVLTKHKKPQVQILPVAADEQRVEVMRDGIAQVWAAIQAGNFYPSPSPMSCATCPFKSRCPVFAGR
jgi:CRISPR/Cas system-associated exonuclease Cas4 (RecB family)